MTKEIKLDPKELRLLRKIDERMMSYNIEMTEVTGGTFWKAYTPEQIAGVDEFKFSGELTDFTAMEGLMQYYPPIDLYNRRLRELTKKFGATWIRVSGTWATQTYYDFDGTTGGKAPEGYQSVLTKKQWIGVLDFVKEMGAKLLISVSNCAGDHPNGGALDLTQTKKIFDFSHGYGVDIDAAEFMNEPNMLAVSGAPQGYTAADYARDQDIFNGWVKENYPGCLLVGPCTLGDGAMGKTDSKNAGAGIGAIMPGGHWDSGEAHTDAYLAVAPGNAKSYAPLRDQYVPNGQMWVTESGDAGGGGNTWASTYLDVLRTLNELGSFSAITDGIIFHNTLASSDYGFLKHETFEPRPNYFAVLLWNTLMGTTVFDCKNPDTEGAHIYCHSRRDGKEGFVYLVINNSLTETTAVELPKDAEIYSLSGKPGIRSSVMYLNGEKLGMSNISDIPGIRPVKKAAGRLELAPATCTFIVI